MSSSRAFNISQDLQIESLQSKLSLYKENISILQSSIEKLEQQNTILKSQLQEKTCQITQLQALVEEAQTIKSPSMSSNFDTKSNLMSIIESFQSQTPKPSELEDLQFEFDDIEKIQNSIKSENSHLKNSLLKFEELYPSMYKISSLTQRLFLAIQSFTRGDPININFLVSSPEKKYKIINVIDHFQEDVRKTKEILEKIIENLSDFYAEKFGSESCKVF